MDKKVIHNLNIFVSMAPKRLSGKPHKALLLAFLIGCSSDASDPAPSLKTAILGTWTESVDWTDSCADPANNNPNQPCAPNCRTAIFTSSTATITGPYSGPYTIEGDSLRVLWSGIGAISYKAAVSNGALVLSTKTPIHCTVNYKFLKN